MSINIKYKNNFKNKSAFSQVIFVDDKFSLIGLNKHISKSEYVLIKELIKAKDLKKY